MNREFSLIPSANPVTEVENISGTIGLHSRSLTITYQVTGDIKSLNIPLPGAAPLRRDGLWKESCFECFVQGVGRADYHEINLSPNGDWNIYHFSGYRSGMVEESGIKTIESTISIEQNMATIHCHIPLFDCHAMPSSMQAGISCVLLHCSGMLSYWALAHPGPRPDFHDARTFCIQLAPAP